MTQKKRIYICLVEKFQNDSNDDNNNGDVNSLIKIKKIYNTHTHKLHF